MVLLKILLVANVFAIALSSQNLLFRNVEDRVVGGFVTVIEQNPWQVSLQYGGHTCGGSIIGKKWVISAAHCSPNSVRVGSSFHARDGKLIRIKKLTRHPNYTLYPIDYDFALLELDEPLKFTNKIQPVALADANTQIADGVLCQVSGWGLTNNASESRDQLRAAHLPIVNQEHCRQVYVPEGKDWQVTERMICAGHEQGNQNSCNGDSGGPLLEFTSGKPRLIGLVSWAHGCAQPHYPTVYSRVSSVRAWIKSVSGI